MDDKNRIDDLLLEKRELFLHTNVNEDSITNLIKSIKYLDYKKHAPITLWINSPGGSTTSGLALIYIMRQVKSKIITIINNQACSMASQISVAGNERLMVANGSWMAHDMRGGIWGDYSEKVKYRAKALEEHYQNLEKLYKKYTKLSKQDLALARNGELWLNAKQCLKKGIIDKII
jgi:ATP-dependent Clp protease protease subunit